MKSMFAALAIALAASPTALGFDRLCTRATGHWGLGTPRAIAISEAHPIPLAITGWGTVLSVSSLDVPTPLTDNSIVVPGVVYDLELDGDLVYAALDQAGVAVFRIDLDGPDVLVPVARIETPGQARGIALGPDTMAVADGDSGFYLFDVSDPTRPVRASAVAAFEHVEDVAFDGTHLVATDRTALRVFDVSDPSRPLELSATVGEDGLTRIAIHGDFVYAGFTGNVPWGISTGGVAVFDLGDLGHPVRVGQVRAGSTPTGIEIVGDLAFVAYDRGLNTWNGALQILRLDDPRQPEVILERTTTDAALAVATNGALTLLGVSGVEVLDTSQPADPTALRTAPDDRLATHGMKFCGEVLVVVDDSGRRLRVLSHDLGRPHAEIGRVTLASAGKGLACAGNVVFAGASGATAVDISDPSRPRVLDILFSTTRGSDVLVLHGDILYTGGESYRVVDASDPSNLVNLGNLDIPFYRGSLAIDGDHLFAAYRNWDGEQRLRVLDIGAPTQPVAVSEIAMPPATGSGFPSAIAVADGLAVITGRALTTIDVSDPGSPTVLGIIEFPMGLPSGKHINLVDDRALVSHGSEIGAIDLSDPASPRVIGTIPTPGSAFSSLWRERELLVADGPQGVTSFDVTFCNPDAQKPLAAISADE